MFIKPKIAAIQKKKKNAGKWRFWLKKNFFTKTFIILFGDCFDQTQPLEYKNDFFNRHSLS